MNKSNLQESDPHVKLHRAVKTVEYWEKELDEEGNLHEKRGRFRILPRGMAKSRAYRALSMYSRSALILVVDQVEYESNSRRKDNKGVGTKTESIKKDIVYLPANLLTAYGIKSSSTQKKVRRELVKCGFLDVVETGSVTGPTRFKYAERWRLYPGKGSEPPADMPPIGVQLYPNPNLNKARKPSEGSQVSGAT